jgi:threonine synthase
MHEYKAHLRCFRGCAGEYSVFEIIYTCPKCGGLLEVQHDIDALRERSADEWKQLFDSRVGSTEWPYGSGVWGKKEWIMPTIAAENVVSMYEGNSNLFWAERLGKQIGLSELWVKLCGNSHTGSFKDLGMTVLVSVVKQMRADGVPVRAVACASTGDTSAALAAYAAAAGIPAVIFLPEGKVTPAQLIQPIANGAYVLALDTDFDGCMRVIREITHDGDRPDSSIYLANSMNSLRIEGQKTVGVEIAQQFDWEVPDWIIMPVGNLGNISALYKGLKMMQELGIVSRLPRLVAAQASKANPFYLSYLNGFREKVSVEAQSTLASAIQIGDPVSYEKAVQAIQETDGIVEQASEHEMAGAAAMADKTGMYTCPHTGTALAALFKLLERKVVRSSERVVVISTAHGLKFTPFKVGYHEGTLTEVESDLANPPVYLPADLEIVKETIQRKLA